MNRIWEAGDEIIRRPVKAEELLGRQYAFGVIKKGKGPFLDFRRMEMLGEGGWLLYRANGCQDMKTALQRGGRGKEVFLPSYLKIMLKMLRALELAEEQLILPSVFIIDESTVFYHETTDTVRFAYVPCQRKERGAAELMLEFLRWIETVDFDFSRRWPMLETTFEEFRRKKEGRNRLMFMLQKWKSEFPETEEFRRRRK